jgi:cytochrome c5
VRSDLGEGRQLFLAVFLGLLLISSCAGFGKVSEKTGKGAIVFDDEYHSFGKVTEGEVVSHTFGFINEGPGAVRLVKTRTSCGCTTTEASLKEYAPGERGELTVTLDTQDKHGIVVKTVDIYLENGPSEFISVSIMAELVPPPHPVVENRLAITNNPKCKSCHLDSGVGQKGGYLYHRICVQCHGTRGKGGAAVALSGKEFQERVTDDYLKNTIVHGLGDLGMPPYVEGVSPPITEEQVDSLIEYLRSLR